MGVKGLWTLLGPVGRPVLLETMEGKVLAIDSSIWIYQFQATMRDKEGRGLVNAHVLGFLRRICKLLYYGIKPVFVFDGGAPALKRVTISERKKRKRGAAASHAKLAEQLLAAQMRKEALSHVASGQASSRRPPTPEDGTILGEDTVYLEDYDGQRAPRRPLTPQDSKEKQKAEAESSAKKKRNKFADMDPYRLPDVDVDATIASRVSATKPDPRLATEEEMRAFIDEMRPDDFDITSPAFRELPTEVQYEIIGDLRLRSRQTSYKRLESMLRNSHTSLDFSRAQIQNLKERNSLTQQLLLTAEGVGKVIDHHLTIPVRVASERNREYVLVKNTGPEGGWVLGSRELGTKDQPIVIDHIKQEPLSEDEDAMEEVPVEDNLSTPTVDPDLREHMRAQALSALAERYTPKKPVAAAQKSTNIVPSLGPAAKPGSKPLFAPEEFSQQTDLLDTVQPEDWEEDPDLSMAIEMSIGLGLAVPDDNPFWGESAAGPSGTRNPASESENEDEDEDTDMVPVPLQEPITEPVVSSLDANEDIASTPSPSLSLSPSPLPQPVREISTTTASSAGISKRPLSSSNSTPTIVSTNSPTGSRALQRTVSTSSIASGSRPTVSVASHTFSAPGLSASQRRFSTSQTTSSSPPKDLLSSDLASGPSESAAPIFRSRPTLSKPVPVGTIPTSGASRLHLSETIRGEPNVVPRVVSKPAILNKDKRPELHSAFSREPSVVASDFQPVKSPGPSPVRSTPTKSTPVGTPSASQRTPSTQPSSSAPQRKAVEIEEEPPEAHLSDEEEIEWSRSPSPTASRSGDVQPPDDWDAAQEMDIEAEETEFANFMSQVKGKDISSMQKEIDEEIVNLNKQRKAALVASEDITQQMVTQIQNMLRLFGIPFITAPMEAEAQCAELVSLGLVEGIITDDSDVFLFGGQRVFKNMFNQSKTVECFLLSDLGRELSLDRDKLIRLAYLLGSDYVDGIPGVGPVVAMELLKEFPDEDGLHKFKDWWMRVQSGKDKPADNATPFRRRFKKRFKELYLSNEWPSSNVRDAYYHPTVDESTEPFKWGLPDLDALRDFLREELSWNTAKVDETLLPIIKRLGKRGQSQTNKQSTLAPFFDITVGTGTYAPRQRQAYASKRLQKVVQDFRKEQRAASEAAENADGGRRKGKGKRKRAAANGAAGGAKKRKSAKGARAESVAESVEDGEPSEVPAAMESEAGGSQTNGGEEGEPAPEPKPKKPRPRPRKIVQGDQDYVPGR